MRQQRSGRKAAVVKLGVICVTLGGALRSGHGGDRGHQGGVRNRCNRELKTATVSLILFNDHEGDVIGLRHSLSESLDGLQERLLERVTSRGSLLPNEIE